MARGDGLLFPRGGVVGGVLHSVLDRRHCGTNLMAEVKSQVTCCFLYEPLACE